MSRPYVVDGARADEPDDPRVAAVLDVLKGDPTYEVAARWRVDPVLLHRWTRAFVEAGSAQVANRPQEDEARRRDRFLAAFAHEVRTPLSVAQGWASLLAEGEVAPGRMAEASRTLRTALDRLGERVRDVELVAAASLGRLVLEPRRTTVGDLVEGLDCPLDEAVAATALTVDPGLFARVVRDLWDAAALAPAPRRRRFGVRRDGPWLELCVLRDGDPIEPAVLQALFDPFDLNDDATGVTLGLYLARALTVAHGGTLGVEQDDDGAALWVRVPEPPADVSRRSRPGTAARPYRG